MTAVGASTEPAPFGDLLIHWDHRVQQPRLWTTAQSYWAAALSRECPDGPILELFCGAGQIGLLAASLTGRSLVQVDRDPVAAAFARRNAAVARLNSDVRVGSVADALHPDEQFGIVVGGDELVLGLGVALHHLHPEGHAIVQVGDAGQVELMRALLNGLGGGQLPWTVLEVRDYSPAGFLVDIGPASPSYDD